MASSEYVGFEQTDEDEYAVRFEVDGFGGLLLRLSTHDAVELYDGLHAVLGGYIAERNAARREYETGIADDPAMQPVLDRIKNPDEAPILTDVPMAGRPWKLRESQAEIERDDV